ncbi:MAG: proline dehydrogenase family protein [Candidatus Polarisedimenticolia bacterium]
MRTAGSPSHTAWDAVPPQASHPDEGGPLRRLRRRIMRLAPRPLVRALARPYVAGETRREAIDVVRRLQADHGLMSTIDVLGEAIHDERESRATLEEYVAILDDLAACRYANISIKLSALGQALDEDLCARQLETLLEHARRHDQFVRLDMEDHTTTDSTLTHYRRLCGRYPRLGIVLQARLHRTPRDVEELAPLRPNVRLCIGIYREPVQISLQDKPAMKTRLLELLETMWHNGQYVAIATHDEAVIGRALQLAERMGKTPADFEVQMLLGVPRAAIQRRLREQGVKVRLYVPYGSNWYHYCLRRLDNSPEMARMVLANLLRRGGRG